ncbi:ABC transporter substrate-binding protein [Desulforamulus aeronauticus]|uniref:Peptide/nickel transport system substrate-binding protein n=1 Tax=Desulforamulus aeronauticus DSM 10349 TaxID=1121421 RepID=A0A1M6QRR0_9FIRM|nr:ABC transporter substrate-binding protein [Desulforamulus aeronauticus]SHK22951.1 peptide/nickel transport system substrate-binding protein [Desulforamulus aeronauticus DSM 10349]
MRGKLYQVAFLLLFLSFFSVVISLQRSNSAVFTNIQVPEKIDLNYALAEPIQTLDPAKASNLAEAKVISNLFEGLVRYKPNSTDVEPCLATTWQISPDGKTWTFQLRKNVKFHDNTPFNAAAVKFSVERQLPPQKKDNMIYGSFAFGMVQAVEAIDDYTVKFTLRSSYAPFIRNLAMPWAAPIVSPSSVTKYGDEVGQHPVGTGPFQLAQWKKENVVLVAFTDYWGDKTPLNSIAFSHLAPAQRSTGLTSGAITLGDMAEVKTKDIPDITLTNQPSASLGYLGLFNNKTPFNQPRVRRAVCMAIDRKEISRKLFGSPSLAANSILPPGFLGYNQNLQPYSGGTVKAKDMLKECGLPNGLDITLITYQGSRPYNPFGGEKLAALIKEQLAPAGIRVKIKTYPWHEFKSALRNQEGDAFLFGWVGDNLDPDNFLYTLLASGEITNLSHYKNSEVDRLISAAQEEVDEKIRLRLYYHAQQIMLQDTPLVFLNYGQENIACRKELQGVEFNLFGIPLLAKAHLTK